MAVTAKTTTVKKARNAKTANKSVANTARAKGNIFEEFEFDEHQLHDGSEGNPIFPNELPGEARTFLALSEEELANEGWTLESVTRFSGPLLVEQV